MAPRLTSRLAALLTRLIRRKKLDRQSRPMARHRDLPAAIPIVLTSEAPPPPYAVRAPLIGSPIGWSVYNCADNRIVATGLSRNRAMTLRDVLNFAGHHRSSPQTGAVHRKTP
jgi:hypothetical protein